MKNQTSKSVALTFMDFYYNFYWFYRAEYIEYAHVQMHVGSLIKLLLFLSDQLINM